MSLGQFRNHKCYCNSGKKYKKCHFPSDDKRVKENPYLRITLKANKK